MMDIFFIKTEEKNKKKGINEKRRNRKKIGDKKL